MVPTRCTSVCRNLDTCISHHQESKRHFDFIVQFSVYYFDQQRYKTYSKLWYRWLTCSLYVFRFYSCKNYIEIYFIFSAETDPHEGKRKVEGLWPIFRIHHQKSRYIFDLFYKRKAISRGMYFRLESFLSYRSKLQLLYWHAMAILISL